MRSKCPSECNFCQRQFILKIFSLNQLEHCATLAALAVRNGTSPAQRSARGSRPPMLHALAHLGTDAGVALGGSSSVTQSYLLVSFGGGKSVAL